MIKYDPEIIQELAECLYTRAAWIVGLATAVGVLFGLLCGYVQGDYLNLLLPGQLLVGLGVVVFTGILGWVVGTHKACSLRLQAQNSLCQVQIERNTRGRDSAW